jgi:phenylacetate-CoA ligase
VACEQQGLEPAALGVRAVMVAGEPYGLAWAEDVQRRWGGARLYEQYGCTERAFAWTCPGGVVKGGALGALHFPPENAYVEVVDPGTGRSADDGGWGELIVTPLEAASSPLVRFATGDRVRFVGAASCPCGSPLPGIAAGGVERYDDMLKIRGVNVWPRSVDAVVLALPGVAEYRGTVSRSADGHEVVAVQVEPTADAGPGVGAAVAEAVRRETGLHITAEVVLPKAISGGVPEGFVKISRWRDVRRETARSAAAQNPTR